MTGREESKKEFLGILIVILVFLVAFIIGRYFAGSSRSDDDEASVENTSDQNDLTESDSVWDSVQVDVGESSSVGDVFEDTGRTESTDSKETAESTSEGELAKTTEEEHSYGAWRANNDGVTHSRVCACGEVETASHLFSSGVITKMPTHTSDGIKSFTCDDCGEMKTESIPADVNNHIYGSWEHYNCEYHIRYCQCGKSETREHTFNDGVVTKAPTTTDYGIINYICSGCRFTYDDLIPKLEDSQTQEPPTQETRDYYYQCVCSYCEHYDGAKHLVLYNGVKVDVKWVCSACGRENWHYMTMTW